MGLEVLFNKTKNLHENVQFNRVIKRLIPFFDEQGWDGLLIGNPSNEDYPRFRADAILLYTNGIIIIDFKDYAGEILIPLNDEDFGKKSWFINVEDGNKIKIEAGNNHTNPYRQLNSYRGVVKSIIEDDSLMRYVINKRRICALNIFSGPITLNRKTSRKVPYYQLVQEIDLHTFLDAFPSDNKYEEAIANRFKLLFPSDEWKGDLTIQLDSPIKTVQQTYNYIDQNIQPILKEFFTTEGSGILVLESMSSKLRGQWLQNVNTFALDQEVPETDLWCHSSRIANKLKRSTGFDITSLYTVIYGGKSKTETPSDDEENEDEETVSQEQIGIKSDRDIDDAAVIIIPEAHLVSRSLHQSDLLRFGSGRLLEDLFHFIKLKSNNRKLVLIGDPYMLSYGKNEDSALNIETLNELFPDGDILHFRHEYKVQENDNKLLKLRRSIAGSIDHSIFNYLKFNYDQSVILTEHDQATAHLQEWFSGPIENEPKDAVLLYSKKEVRTTNKWIKNNVLKNGTSLTKGDLLLINNNINIPDQTGFGTPTKIVNGSYFVVQEVLQVDNEDVTTKRDGLIARLRYRHLKVKLLANNDIPNFKLIILENYFDGLEDLTREELKAVKIFTSQKLAKLKRQNLFKESSEYQKLVSDKEFIEFQLKIENWQQAKQNNEKVLKKDLKEFEVGRNKIERSYKRNYSSQLMFQLRKMDPYINAALVNFGWAITVHKSVGSKFENVLFKALQLEDSGITNESYFRWLYTGLTASWKTIHVLNPQAIDPFINCHFTDEVEITDYVSLNINSQILSYDNEVVIDELAEHFPGNLIHNIAIFIGKLYVELSDFKIDSVRKYSDYLSKVVLVSKNGNNVIVAINNRGNEEISSVRIEGNDNEDGLVQKAIDQIYEQQSRSSFPTDYRGDIYNQWKEQLASEEITLHLLECHSNEDRLAVVDAEDVVKFNLRYTTGEKNSGFFISLEIKAKSNQALVEAVKELLDEK
jgi:hypothetical protein